jgi:hypothetical protein
MFKARTILLLIFAALTISLSASLALCNKRSGSDSIVHRANKTTHPYTKKLETKAVIAKAFVAANKYNDKVCFLIDMSLPSGQCRFFVYDLQNDTITKAGLVAHGNCNRYWLDGRQYGNTVGCGCTSLGKYKIGYPYVGRFGQAFKLYGLEKTNNMAFDRFVVLHSYTCVPETEVKDEICQSNGCPMVAPGFLESLRPIINRSKKPVLLWIFE